MAQKTLLMILDGWGNSPDPTISAVDQARTPYIDSLYENYANSTLRTDGHDLTRSVRNETFLDASEHPRRNTLVCVQINCRS